MSALLTTTTPYDGVLTDELQSRGTKDTPTAPVGGAPLHAAEGEEIGADGDCREAAVEAAREVLNLRAKAGG